MSPHDSDDLTFLIKEKGSLFVVLRSADAAEHTPDYVEIAEFGTRGMAEAFVAEADAV